MNYPVGFFGVMGGLFLVKCDLALAEGGPPDTNNDPSFRVRGVTRRIQNYWVCDLRDKWRGSGCLALNGPLQTWPSREVYLWPHGGSREPHFCRIPPKRSSHQQTRTSLTAYLLLSGDLAHRLFMATDNAVGRDPPSLALAGSQICRVGKAMDWNLCPVPSFFHSLFQETSNRFSPAARCHLDGLQEATVSGDGDPVWAVRLLCWNGMLLLILRGL